MTNTFTSLNSTQLKRALTIREKIESLERDLAALCGAAAPAETKGAAQPKKRRMSAAGRAAISRAAKARWAKVHAAQKAKK